MHLNYGDIHDIHFSYQITQLIVGKQCRNYRKHATFTDFPGYLIQRRKASTLFKHVWQMKSKNVGSNETCNILLKDVKKRISCYKNL